MDTPHWWWAQDDEYTIDEAVPHELTKLAGPNGVALVKAWESGSTQKGWGLKDSATGDPSFMPKYLKGDFLPRRAVHAYEAGSALFAFVMRSMSVVCIDIDGKNGGIDHAPELLGNVPFTLAERSKSGNGFHLYFSTAEMWSPTEGYAIYDDAISIVTGVDIRATGCVYHYPQQRWNSRPIAPLPQWIADRLAYKKQYRQEASARLQHIKSEGTTDMDILLERESLIEELNKPIPAGKRNNSLFAIGSQLVEAGVDNWEELIRDRANTVGLEEDETNKLVRNIDRYVG